MKFEKFNKIIIIKRKKYRKKIIIIFDNIKKPILDGIYSNLKLKKGLTLNYHYLN
jgi:hypothetical protein